MALSVDYKEITSLLQKHKDAECTRPSCYECPLLAEYREIIERILDDEPVIHIPRPSGGYSSEWDDDDL